MTFDFEVARKKYNEAWYQIKKMDYQSLNLFIESHGINVVIESLCDIYTAQKYINYKYLEKLCALNAISMPDKWMQRLKDAEEDYRASIKTVVPSVELESLPDKRGSRATIIKTMLLEGKSRYEIKTKMMELFPEIPHPNIGCQIAATICFLKKKGVKIADSNEEVHV